MIETILSQRQRFTNQEETLIALIIGTEKNSYILVRKEKITGWMCSKEMDLELKSKLRNHMYNIYVIDKKKLEEGETNDK